MGVIRLIWAQMRKGVESSWERPQSSRVGVGQLMTNLELLQVDVDALFYSRRFEKGGKRPNHVHLVHLSLNGVGGQQQHNKMTFC